MQIVIQPQTILFAIICIGVTVAIVVASYWLINDSIAPKSSGGATKAFVVYGEYTVARELAVVRADTEEEAEALVQAKADEVARELGVDHPDIVWAEEKQV